MGETIRLVDSDPLCWSLWASKAAQYKQWPRLGPTTKEAGIITVQKKGTQKELPVEARAIIQLRRDERRSELPSRGSTAQHTGKK